MTPMLDKGIDPNVERITEQIRAADSSDRQGFIERFEKDTAYYFHQQYTDSEKDRLAELKQMDVTIDRCRPIIRRTVAKIVRTRPMIAALSIDTNENAIALSRRINAQAQYAMRISKGLTQIRKVVLNCVRGGLGFIEQYKDKRSEKGVEVKFRYITPKKVYVDGAVEDSLFDDARYIAIVEKQMVSDMIQEYSDPDQIAKIINSKETSFADGGSEDDTIVDSRNEAGEIVVGSTKSRFVDLVDMEDVDFNGYCEKITFYEKDLIPTYKLVGKDPDGNVIDLEVTKEDAQDSKKNNPDVKVEVSLKPAIRRTVCTPLYELEQEVLTELAEYPITPFIWEDTENAYPVSETFFIRGIQKLSNAFWRTVLANAQASSFPNIWAEEDSFTDKDEALTNMSKPMGYIELRRGALSQKRVEKNYAQPLNQAYFQLLQFTQHEQEYQASSPAIQQGDPANAPETNKALVNMDNFADRALVINTDSIEAALERVFKNIIRMQLETYTDNKLLLIDADPQNNVVMNETISDVDDEGNVHTYNRSDFELTEYDISIVPGSMSPLDKTSEFQYAAMAVQMGAPPEFALKKMPITGIDEVVRDMNSLRQLAQQNQQLVEQLEMMKKELQRSVREETEAEKKVDKVKAAAKLEVIVKQQQNYTNQLKSELRKAQRINNVLESKYNDAVKRAAQPQKESADRKE